MADMASNLRNVVIGGCGDGGGLGAKDRARNDSGSGFSKYRRLPCLMQKMPLSCERPGKAQNLSTRASM